MGRPSKKNRVDEDPDPHNGQPGNNPNVEGTENGAESVYSGDNAVKAPVAVARPSESRKSVSVTFIGDPRGGKDPEIAEYAGMHFPKGKAVPVEDVWLQANSNIRQNNHFKVG